MLKTPLRKKIIDRGTLDYDKYLIAEEEYVKFKTFFIIYLDIKLKKYIPLIL